MSRLMLFDDGVRAQWCFRVVNESGQVILLLSLIAIGREIGREVQVRKERTLATRRGGTECTMKRGIKLTYFRVCKLMPVMFRGTSPSG